MGWQDLLHEDAQLVAPWVGGAELRRGDRRWRIEGRVPEHGWYVFNIGSRTCRIAHPTVPDVDLLVQRVRGYLVGDRLVLDSAAVPANPDAVADVGETVYLVAPGLDRFARVSAGRFYIGGPLVYVQQEFPLGPEVGVQAAFLDRRHSLQAVAGVTPALETAFRLESYQRAEVERRRAELERLRREEAERQAKERLRQKLLGQVGNGETRRQLAQIDFAAGARAALLAGQAEYLDHQQGRIQAEMVVRFRVDGRRFECVCDAATLRIVDSGICLTDHRGVKGDTRFTLESLPSVIREATRDRKLVVYRRVDDNYDDREDWDD